VTRFFLPANLHYFSNTAGGWVLYFAAENALFWYMVAAAPACFNLGVNTMSVGKL
jgi:hypothetical protein